MSYNATRLTCFAIISSIETDCREALLAADANAGTPLIWPESAMSTARTRMARERKTNVDDVDALIQYLDFADSYQILLSNKTVLDDSISRSLKALGPQLEDLVRVRNRVAHSRPMEVGDLALASDIANELARIAPDAWTATAETIQRLMKDPAFVLGLTVELPGDPVVQAQHNLPIPDFDETGFFGRSIELRRIKKAILGAYPVVSVLGDGGIGKTAIALKVAYDLLDSENLPFDAIVWASAKSTTLTNSEISTISGAIQDSLGLFEAATAELGGALTSQRSDPMIDLLDYLEQFKILLILDNLETVTDQRLRNFLLDLPLGSKVLLTSRIGLGIENPVKLEPLSIEESKRLLKALSGIRGVEILKAMPDDDLNRLVSKLRGHPLYIKWLVAGVQAGRRPSELVNDNSLLLEFCMSNVWDKLALPARNVLQAMQVARGQRNLAELAFLSDMSAQAIQSAVLDLMTTNFVTMKHTAEGDLEGAFETGEFASQYLSRHQPPSAGQRSLIAARARELEELGKDLMAKNRLNPFDPYTIDVRDRTDVPTARLLNAALRHLRTNSHEDALEKCREAQALSPTYGEVWRIQGLVNEHREDLNAATIDYQRAHEYADRSAVMAFHVALFYANVIGDLEKAAATLNDALRLDPHNPMLLFSFGEISFRFARYRDTLGACAILAGLRQSSIAGQSYAVLCLRAAVFGAEQALWDGDIGQTIELLEDMSDAMTKIGPSDMDDICADLLIRLRATCLRVQDEAGSQAYLSKRAAEFQSTFEQRVRIINPSALSRSTGQIRKLDETKRFGFIAGSPDDFFFHRNDLAERDDWAALNVNTLAAFDVAKTPKGLKAMRVRPLL